MKKNYYDLLEVSKYASPEIIEKSYKTLVKKYHPDLKENSQKQKSEEILKKLNEAYEILSNPEKRKIYDISLQEQQTAPKQEKSKIYNQNITPKRKNFKTKPKKTYKEYQKDLIALFLTILIIFVIFQIPFIKKITINFYNNNLAFKQIIDALSSIFTN